MKRQHKREVTMEVTVGVFAALILLALAFFTIVLSRESLSLGMHRMNIFFDRVQGLRKGDNVFLRGVVVGRINKIQVMDAGVCVSASVEKDLRLREDYKIEILTASVLGGRYLDIYEGSPDAPLLPPQEKYRGTTPIDMIDQATRAIHMLKETLEEGQVLENLRLTAANIRELTGRLTAGEGTLGRLFTDTTVYDELKSATANLNKIAAGLAAGEGTLGGLLVDAQLYLDLKTVAGDLKGITARIAAGEGTIGRLLSSDDRLYVDLSETVAAARGVAESLRQGQGTIGKLLTDEEVYNELKLLVREVRAAVDDLREVTPVTTFSSIVFGAF